MKIFLASDHAGFELKSTLAGFLYKEGRDIADLGPETFMPADDYPDYILPLAKKVAKTPGSLGIAVGMSGQGEAMAANRVKGVRAAVYYGGNPAILKLSREHNDANVLSLSARFLPPEEAKAAVLLWLGTHFTGEERHLRRIEKLDA